MDEGPEEWSLELPGDVDDVHVDNAPVRRHGHGGLTIEGYSRAAVQTYWRIPELKIGFDLGLQPWAFMATATWAVRAPSPVSIP